MKVTTRAERFFERLTQWPKITILTGLLLIVAMGWSIPSLQKDTRSDAFMPPDHPALLYRDKVKEVFGLNDPMVIAVVNEGEHGIFNPHSLALVAWLSREVEEIAHVDADRITSLATESDIIGTADGMLVEPFFESPPERQADADAIRTAVMDFPLYMGSLVARDGSATLIVAELNDQAQAQGVYEALLELIQRAPKGDGDAIYVAGEGAVSGYMGAYIDADAQRLNPIAGLVITLVLFVAFRTLRGALLPNLVVFGTVASALGVMAAFEVPFFVITNALPVVLIGIAVADSIHIMSQYYEEVARYPNENGRQLAIRAMVKMWRPITLTTLTTMAGFLGLSVASIMPPMAYFGLFAMLGVAVAWLYSMTVVPAFLTLLKPKRSKAILVDNRVDGFGRAMSAVGQLVIRRPGWVLTVAVLVVVGGLVGASKLELNEARITVFQEDEAIVQADSAINRHLDGAHYLDVVIETPQIEDLFKPEHLRRIEALQRYVATLPHVNGSTSIVDYLKQMNRALNSDQAEAYQLPSNAELVAQYFLLYSASGDPGDFEKEVDYDYRLANVRVRLDTGLYSVEKQVIEALDQYITEQFNGADIQANLSGRVNIDYHWIKSLGESHFGSVAISLLLVMLMAALSLRSAVAGIITVIPVAVSVLLIYAVMGFGNIWLAIGTSMFAAIAIGLGVDFSVHTIERLQVLIRKEGRSIDEAIAELYPSTGRALLFNFAALTLGFGVLISSEVVPLTRFGALVAVAVTSSFIASMTLLPALIKLLKPRFIQPQIATPAETENDPAALVVQPSQSFQK
ncbi:MAG: MMPL family transporter [Gammaproteobacteria bacterium]|nr:MMPL family transporter [Gammaproteobacteria bacterium]